MFELLAEAVRQEGWIGIAISAGTPLVLVGTYVGLVRWIDWAEARDLARNWHWVGSKDGIRYWQHNTKQKRRWERVRSAVDLDWLRFKKDEL